MRTSNDRARARYTIPGGFRLRCVRSSFFWVLGLVNVACGQDAPSLGGQTGEVRFGCLESASSELDLGDSSRLGFSPQDLLDIATGTHTATLSWTKGNKTELTIQVAYQGGAARYVERVWKNDDQDSQSNIGTECGPRITVPVHVRVVTEDGTLNEKFETLLAASALSLISIYADLGPHSVANIHAVGNSVDITHVTFTAEFVGRSTRGRVSGTPVRASESTPPGPSSNFDLGVW